MRLGQLIADLEALRDAEEDPEVLVHDDDAGLLPVASVHRAAGEEISERYGNATVLIVAGVG